MPHGLSLITTIAASFGLAFLLGFVAVRLRLPAIVGYLVAGILIGPATPGFVADAALSSQLAEIGVMLLMFGVGLHFSIEDLLAARRVALPGALIQITVATGLGAGAAALWGWGAGAGLVFGLALSVASTVVLLRALEQRGAVETANGRIAVGWLVVEDLVMVVVLVLLPAIAGGAAAASGADLWRAIAITLAKIAAFVGLMLVVGRRIFPWLLWQVARTGSRELFTLGVIAAAVGTAFGASELFGVSFALGAFFGGMVLRGSALSHRAADESLPLRDAFAVLFFVSVGMLFDPRILVTEPLRVLTVLGIILVGKTVAAAGLVLALRYPLGTALTVSAGLAQIGEFSFILAGLGVQLGVLPAEGQDLILAGALLSIALNPLLFSAIDPLTAWLRARNPRAAALASPDDPLAVLPDSVAAEQLTGHVLLAGYGRVGGRIGRKLASQGIPFVVVEEDRVLVESLRDRGVHAVAGDAAEPGTLIQGHVARAAVLVIAIPDAARGLRMMEIARMLNPGIRTVVRTHDDEDAERFRKERADAVVLGEGELADGMIRPILELRALE